MSDAVNISALNQYTFCPRRCALIYVEQAWTENLHTQSGRREHEQADVPEYEMKAGVRIERALPVWSEKIGLIGKCDVVEFHENGGVYPVEYKHGKRRQWDNDDIQLCAQAMCLEEMLEDVIDEGAIYHITSRRRRKVTFDKALREQVRGTANAVHDLIENQAIPEPVFGRYCEQCSLRDACMPDVRTVEVNLFEPLSENVCARF